MGLFDNAVSVEMTYVTCYKCGVLFGMPQGLYGKLIQNHNSFFCVNGHSQAFLAKSEADKLRDEKVRLQAQLDQSRAAADNWRKRTEQTERSLSATKGVVTGMKRRLAKGKCVRCSKSFHDLAEHMKTTHPDLIPQESKRV